MSASRMPLRRPLRANCKARLTVRCQEFGELSQILWEAVPAIVDFPTPPFADETATTFSTLGILRLGGSPRRGI